MRGKGRFGPLTERPFRLLWIGRTGSSLGDSLVVVAIPFAVLRIGGGATGLGVVLAAYTLGRAVFIMAGGVWADRLPRRAVMIGADLVRFGTQATTAVLLFTHALQVWELAALQATAGAAGGFFMPASTALVPRTISAGRLQQANALLSLSQSATGIFGPAVSGAIVATAGPAWVFVIDAGSFLFSVAFLFALRVHDQFAAARQRFWHDLADGWREVRRIRWLTAGFLGFALGNVGIGMYLVLGPLVAREHLGGAAAWGLILTAGAVGGVVGGLVAYRVRPQRPVVTAFGLWSLGLAPALALVPPLPVAAIMAANALFFGSVIVGNTLWETSMQRAVQPERLARVGSIDWMLSLCLMPAGQVLAGPISEAMGVRGTLVLAGALMCIPNLLVIALVREVRQVRRRETPEPASVTS
jgi:MFS family permease